MKEITHLEMQNAPHCHSRENGNPDSITEGMDSRLRGNDKIHGSDEICWNDRVKYFVTQSAQQECRKFIGYILTIGIFLVPHLSLATGISGQCFSNGYTIATINGVFTDEQGAKKNMLGLREKFGLNWLGQNVSFDYLLNPSHLAGVGDLLMSVYQKIFDKETVEDYDLIEIQKSASEKVKTQKLLLVAHSQGNFYANSFYDIVAGKQGGVPAESIGVYGVATPSSRVAGGGKWLTSDTDKVIASVVGHVPFRKIMSPNTSIELQNGDDPTGHNFKDIYLKYRSAEIVAGIQSSLNRLSKNTSQNENKSCISPPELTLAHKIEGAILAVADPVANTSSNTVAFSVKTGVTASMLAYDTAVSAVKTVTQTAIATASSITSAVKSLTGGMVGNLNGNNSAAIVATQKVPLISPNNIAVVENKTVPVPTKNKQSISTPTSPPVLRSENKLFLSEKPLSATKMEVKAMTEKNSSPKLIFVGLRMSGRGSAPPLASVEKIEVAKEKTETEPVVESEKELSPPALTVPQCADSLATDSCLLATTTLRFEWAPISGAFYYALNKNGIYATITETALDITASDFSDYTFEVIAVGASGQKSATSSKIISVATIPIAINEIAWMGTLASANDEWFELKNNTAFTIDLSQWVLASQDGAPYVKLSKTIAPHEYLIFERTDSMTVADVIEHSVYTGALNNSGDNLSLSYGSTTMDQTPSGAWTAGYVADKKTMERYASKESGADILNWGTNLGFISNGEDADGNNINGTPGARNSVSFLINKGRDITENLTLTADDGSFVVPRDVSISASSTLIVKPGVGIVFYKDSFYRADGSFYVQGILDAQGTAENPIVFSSYSEDSGNQNGDLWFDSRAGTSTLDNVRLENTKDVGLNNSKLEIRNTEFANTDGGVNAFNGSSVIIENVRFTNLTDDAIGAYNNSAIIIASTTIDGVKGGDSIGAYNSSIVTIASSTINNVEGDGVGAYNSSIITIASSTISNIGGDGVGIGVYNDSALVIASSSIKNISKGDGIGVYNNSTISIVSTTLDGVNDGDGITIDESTLAIASSTVKNVSEDGINLSHSTSTISNTLVQDGGENGIDIYGGTTIIEDSTVSGFITGVGVLIDSSESAVEIIGGEITGNSVGVAITEGATVVLNGVVHSNDVDIVVCAPLDSCP